jgi:hypothetical protein
MTCSNQVGRGMRVNSPKRLAASDLLLDVPRAAKNDAIVPADAMASTNR